ncbi:MAG: hypothetical protein K0S41_2071 [Anaerocolumna sp.]|nr:hypothetical protein [Anaerocolumna sp.]
MNNYIVYCHENKINNKKYFGITFQKINQRWKNGKGYKGCTSLNGAIQKYGWNNFNHIILLENISKEIAEESERFLINKFKSNDKKYGYNIANGGNSNGKHSKDTLLKLSKSHSGSGNAMYGKSGKDSPISKKVICLTTNKIFDSINEAAEFYNIQHAHISACCKGRLFSTGRYNNICLQWAYYDDSNEYVLKDYKRDTNIKSVICITTGIIFKSMKDAEQHYKIRGVSGCCLNNRNYAGMLTDGTKLKWMYYDEYLKLISKTN